MAGALTGDHLNQPHVPRLLLLGAGGVSQQAAEQVHGEQAVGRGDCQEALTGDHLDQPHVPRLLLLGAGGVGDNQQDDLHVGLVYICLEQGGGGFCCRE